MKTSYLLPYEWKKAGWIVFIPSIAIGLYLVITEYEPSVFDLRLPSIFVDDFIDSDKKLYGIVENNFLNEIVGVLAIISGLVVAFSKEKIEDEFISKIRLESLVWATYVNYGVLLITILFVYDFSFFYVMIFNMFTILLFFIIRFNWQKIKLNKSI
ncbi:hypothetical protein [Marinigracilibium pacificum]|uniref:Uncharacterized protein n=1 Tax=Marinigracilibium pacificum TaxID=2729599 RepID=A0A848IWY1_9BACT|nr:hypothetical protein [Marinigracilibium pacificum]NMM47791.1 hypothetical protein [Marinigracilibium pacificum]